METTGPPASRRAGDALIRALITQARPPTQAERGIILDLIATAPFRQIQQRSPRDERGMTYRGQTLGSRADSLFLHLVRRVVGDAQWADGTTEADYLASLRRAARAPIIEIVLYRQWGERHIAAAIADTAAVLAPEQRGPRSLPNLIVIYSADAGCIITGYQFSGRETLALPQEVVWST